MAGRKGSPEGAPPPPSAKESARTDRADRRGPPRAGFRGGAPPANARSGEGAPRPRPRRGGADARAKDRPPAAVRTRANGRTPAGAADGRAGPSGPTRPTACLPTNERGARADRPPADRNAMAARVRTDRPPADQRTRREGRTADLRPRCSLVARSLLARSSLAARCARRGAERSESPAGAARGEAPHTPSGLMGRTAGAERG